MSQLETRRKNIVVDVIQTMRFRQLEKLLLMGVVCLVAGGGPAPAQQPAPAQEPAPAQDLSVRQALLADRYERLEMVAARLAELSAGTDPQRARRLREAIALSREHDVVLRFEETVRLLETERLASAVRNQGALQGELQQLLDLLLKDNRRTDIESEQRRIRRYLREIGKLIRWQKGIRARTEADDQLEALQRDQAKAARQTDQLGGKIEDAEGPPAAQSGASNELPDDGVQPPGQGGSPQDPAETESPPTNPRADAESDAGSDTQEPPTPSFGAPAESAPPAESPSQTPSKQGPSGEPQSSEGSAGEEANDPSAEPIQRASSKLRAAAERMQRAQEQLERANRDGAAQEQRQAVRQLEEARAELERVLRQLREEERERSLTMLAARFRKMLEAQVKVYEGTLLVAEVSPEDRDHRHEIEAARLSRKESLIVRDADKALLLLREEGSSVAFPETVLQMREDMQQVTNRLGEVQVGVITQGLEQDIIEALEEAVAALETALKELEEEQSRSGEMPSAGQSPEPALVNKIAELKMIRSLQLRINRRTQRYGEMVDGEQASSADLVEALQDLGQRQERVYRATKDLSLGRND